MTIAQLEEIKHHIDAMPKPVVGIVCSPDMFNMIRSYATPNPSPTIFSCLIKICIDSWMASETADIYYDEKLFKERCKSIEERHRYIQLQGIKAGWRSISVTS